MEFRNKTVLIVAQEDWGDMYVSKHHYAHELAKAGNTVYFMNGPDQVNKLRPGEVRILASGIDQLFLVEHRFFYPYITKFKANWIHQLLVQVHIGHVLKKIGKNID